MFHIILLRCDAVDQGARVQERLAANRFDLTLQGGPNQRGTHKPVGPHAPTIPLPATNYRTAPPAYSQPSPTRDHQK